MTVTRRAVESGIHCIKIEDIKERAEWGSFDLRSRGRTLTFKTSAILAILSVSLFFGHVNR